jgi:undecaprenyl diphosphate synthase
MVVGGTLRDWEQLGDDRWDDRVERLGAIADSAGASFLTLRAYEPGADPIDLEWWHRVVGSCDVIVDPCGDGRQRFAEAMQRLQPDEPVNEATVAEALYAPADCEPDLIVVLGESTRLPPSLVWELAYGELVFHPMAWSALSPDHLLEAIADFARRQRRFGGLDDDG